MADDEADALAAGDFAPWLVRMQGALRGEHDADVPCGACTACCRSSQFIHIGPAESDTLAHIPKALLFPAPHMPKGHVLLGYDERGHCPMLVDDACSIYEHRPRTCRAYDCRVFPASGVAPDDDKPLIARQVRRWRFGIGTPAEQVAHDATRAAAVFLRERPGLLPTGVAPRHATQLAGTAVDVHAAFVGHHAVTGEPKVVDPSPEVVAAAVLRGTTRPR